MSELQPGMLAMVIGAEKDPANIGKIVTIVKEAPQHWIEAYDHGFIVDGVEPYEWCLTKNLMPIKPEADPLEIKVNQELHA